MVRNLNRKIWSVVAAGLWLSVSQGHAGEYEIVDLGATVSYDINTSGEAVVNGYRDRAGSRQWWAFLWKGELAAVDVPDDDGTVETTSALAMNDFGDVAGNHSLDLSSVTIP